MRTYSTADFLNRPVLSITDGVPLGTVVSYKFDLKVKRLTHFVVARTGNFLSVPSHAVIRKDSDALVVCDLSGITRHQIPA